ncbi:MAG TPA: CRISPR-associated protein Csx15 [Ktedonobacteraceae bacterium]|nr:CRISPR-associated protein Csx15 [Ktedonobacteraceae bacterium]
MLIINFTHPLTEDQRAQIETLAGSPIEDVRNIPVQINQAETLAPQVAALVDAVGLSSEEWQTLPLLINPPGFAPATFVLLAELHGRIGHFPALVRLRPVADSVPTRYEVAELLNLQTIRDQARYRRLA